MDETETFNIYFTLQQGQKADIETVSHALLEFAAAVKEAAYFVDPSLDLRIEFASGTEGSLDLKTVFRAVRAKSNDKAALKGVAWGATTFLFGLVGTDLYNKSPLHKAISGPENKISDADVQRVAERAHEIPNLDWVFRFDGEYQVRRVALHGLCIGWTTDAAMELL